MRVLKFGGTSVANAERLKGVADIITDKSEDGEVVFAVVSAFSGVTDSLLEIISMAVTDNSDYTDKLNDLITRIEGTAKAILSDDAFHEIEINLKENHDALCSVLNGVSLIQEASDKSRDYILSFGERNSAFILCHYLQSNGHKAQYVDSRNYILTDDNFGSARVNFEESYSRIADIDISTKNVFVVTGFIGSDLKSGRTTTLGRGGSDYTAAIFAAGLGADFLEIWTDVNGVLTANPTKVSKAFTIPEMTYTEALEMSHFGAKVLYAPTIRPVRSHGIPTLIKNTFNPDHPGTIIQSKRTSNPKILTGLSSIDNIALLSIEGTGLQGVSGFASRFFNTLASNDVNIIMITQASSEQSISIAIRQEKLQLAKKIVEDQFEYEIRRRLVDPIKISTDLSLLAIVGENMKNSPGVSGRLFHTLGINGINVEAISQGSSELNITFAIKTYDEKRALNSIHDSFFLSHYKTIHLFIVGVGLIGSRLLEQIHQNSKRIKESLGIELIINGLSNSKNMLISPDALDIQHYKNLLETSDDVADIDVLIEKILDYNFAHSIFVDNTASIRVPEYYKRLLENNISISTPNKIAMSSELKQFQALKTLSKKKSVPFKYETNVAAGLPVISTLENLINSGDEITCIEAVLSGSVSYIFNCFSSESAEFSEIVREAKDLGFTEPDPREDLSGADVRRKILILAREAGAKIESDDIKIIPFLNDSCIKARSVNDFYSALEEDNERYKSLVRHAEKENKRLRFVARYENGKGEISLNSVSVDHPFYSLSGSDNMIVFSFMSL